MKSGLALLALAGTVVASDMTFEGFEKMYRKVYPTSQERALRKGIFERSVAAARGRNGLHGRVHGVTKFSDLTDAEFSAMYLSGYKPAAKGKKATEPNNSTVASPSAVDWRTKDGGILTPIKDQGHCGSCWAFSVVEQVEAQGRQAGILAKNEELSVQQMVDCNDFSHGCAGGSPETAYDYLTISGGLTTATKYGPYIGNATEKCHFDKSTAVITAANYPAYKSISSSKSGETEMYSRIQKSPMAICVQADLWKSYTSGVITGSSGCGGQSPDVLNHCVQVIGVGVDSTMNSGAPYWIVRNSWGKNFGNDGYVYLATGDNVCGIAMEVTIASGLSS